MTKNLQTKYKAGVLIIGNFLSAEVGTQGVCEILAEKLRSEGYAVETTSSKVNRFLKFTDMMLCTLLKRHQYDMAQIDVFSGKAFFWAEATSWLLYQLNKPYVLTLHGGKLPTFANAHPRRVARVLKPAAAVTTPSAYLENEMAVYRGDIIHLPNGIDVADYNFRLRDQPQPRLVWLRAFHEIYNPLLAVQTVARLKDEFPDLELTMYGPDKKDKTLESTQEFVRQNALIGSVRIAGKIAKTNVPSSLAPCDIFLNTTTAESFGVSVMEAAALGMCIVSTNVGELPFIWTQERDAILVPPNDPGAMASAVRRILTEPGLAERLSRNARAKAEQFDWSIILPQWEELLSSVVERTRVH